MIDDSKERLEERMIFLRKLINLRETYFNIMNADEHYRYYFNEVMDIVDTHTIDYYHIDYTNIKARNDSNKNITWEYVQSTDNYYDKYTFAEKVLDRSVIVLENMDNISQLMDLSYHLGIITNIKNFYFNLSKEEAIQKCFEHRYKRFNTIFKDEIRALALDYRRFNDINRFSETSYIDEKSGIRITQDQGFELVEIGNLICNNKLKKASTTLFRKIVPHVKGIHWPE